jgi:peptidoglycan/LPS O-acetylase OafA/YrhL
MRAHVSAQPAETGPPAGRLQRLDVLRAIAVVLVMGRHLHSYDMLVQMGWTGVDLFFVLSGFLVSGLLFAEYKARGALDVRRFFIRRGFKIYPAFYVMITATLLWRAPLGAPSVTAAWKPEVFFYQNYVPGLWAHTWSLAVEEHFYILLPLTLLILCRRSPGSPDPFRAIPVLWVPVALGSLVLRIITTYTLPYDYFTHLFPTHLRLDGLYFGAVIGYLHHFRPDVLPRLVGSGRRQLGIAVASAACLVPCFLWLVEGPFMSTIGLTLLYLGFGGVLVLALHAPLVALGGWRVTRGVTTALAYAGRHSYSIYLWHVPVLYWVIARLGGPLHLARHANRRFVLYVVLCTIVGIALAWAIEMPSLRARNRLFPGRVPTPPLPAPREAHAR